MLSKSLFGALLAFAIADAALADISAERDIKLTGDAMIYGGDIGDPVGAKPMYSSLTSSTVRLCMALPTPIG